MDDYVDEVIAGWAAIKPGLDTSAVAVVSRILRSAQLLQAHLDEVAAGRELSHKGDLDTLTALRRAGKTEGLSPTALAQIGQVTSGGMTNRLDRLEAAGLIRRRPHPADRRAVRVHLTAAGERLADEAFLEGLRHQETLLAALTASERSHLADLLRRLLTALGDVPLGTEPQ